MRTRTTQKGFSIVELMVALLLGLFLVSGVTGMYLSSKQTYRMTDNLSRLQESLRFSLDFISGDIRMAGYLPCRFPPTATNVITNSGSTWFLDFFNFGIRGYEGGSSVFPVEISGDVVANTDAIAILKGSNFASTLSSHNTTGNVFTLDSSFTNSDFERGRIGIACDPGQASMFQISDANPNLKTINYGDNTNIVPGNSGTAIGSYGDDALVASYKPVIYYIRPSTQNPNLNSLWRSNLVAFGPPTGTNIAQMDATELLEGVESMQILYGIDVDNDQIADRFEAANEIAANEWLNVITVRLGLLMATGEEVSNQIDNNNYNVAGTVIPAPATPADRRLRYVVNTTINLRNRVQ